MPSSTTPWATSDNARVALRRSPAPAWRRISGSMAGFEAGLDGIKQLSGNVQSKLGVQFADTGWAGDIDLGKAVANDVQADEQHAATAHFRADNCRNVAVGVAQGTPLATTPCGPVAAELLAPRVAGGRSEGHTC